MDTLPTVCLFHSGFTWRTLILFSKARRHNKSEKPFGYFGHFRKLFRISERTFSDLGARVYIRLHLVVRILFRILHFGYRFGYPKTLFGFVMTPRLRKCTIKIQSDLILTNLTTNLILATFPVVYIFAQTLYKAGKLNLLIHSAYCICCHLLQCQAHIHIFLINRKHRAL